MIVILPPLGKYKYDTWRILLVKCYIDNSVHLQSYIQNINSGAIRGKWRILDGKEGEWPNLKFRAPRW
jgi:hypothetical protein